MSSDAKVFAGNGFNPDGRLRSWVVILDEPISGRAKRGDFDQNGVLDAADIDLLSREILSGGSKVEFNLNHDASVDQVDRFIWVQDLAKTYFGDADLNGEFNSSDLNIVFVAGKYETGHMAGWAEGDWDGSGFFNSSDFVTAFIDGGYEQGPRAAVNAVPEPSIAYLLVFSACGLICWIRPR